MIEKKQSLREKLLKLRELVNADERAKHALLMCEKLLPFLLSLPKKTIHTFIPFKNEPDLHPLLDALLLHQQQLVAPKTLKGGKLEHYIYTGKACLKKGLYQTYFPDTVEWKDGDLSAILVPGLAFDQYGGRLGYGGGYYDRFMEKYPKAIKIGIIYPFQFLEEIPVESHDISVDWVFTTALQETIKKN